MDRFVVAMTGASGALYGKRLLELLPSPQREVHLILSRHAQQVLAWELGPEGGEGAGGALRRLGSPRVTLHANEDLASPLASGSFLTRAMVIVPCSANTVGKIASGMGDTLIARAAQVHLKEQRGLILVPRESPLSLVLLENLLRVGRAGALILPASPAFYHLPTTLTDLVDSVVGRILDHLGVPHRLAVRWRPR